jgi:hypothetical protein
MDCTARLICVVVTPFPERGLGVVFGLVVQWLWTEAWPGQLTDSHSLRAHSEQGKDCVHLPWLDRLLYTVQAGHLERALDFGQVRSRPEFLVARLPMQWTQAGEETGNHA